MTDLTEYREDRIERVEKKIEKARESGIFPDTAFLADALDPEEYVSLALQREIVETEDEYQEFPYALIQFPEEEMPDAKVYLIEAPPEDEEE